MARVLKGTAVKMPFYYLDNPPKHVTIERGFEKQVPWQYMVSCDKCGKAESTYSPTEADAIVSGHRHPELP
jgi:hypothetical protein